MEASFFAQPAGAEALRHPRMRQDCREMNDALAPRPPKPQAPVVSPARKTTFKSGEVFASVQDMIHAAILCYGNKATLRQVYTACHKIGRIVCRKTGGCRWITDNSHWKSQVRHTLYTSGRFCRAENDVDYWEVHPKFSHCCPQTTSPVSRPPLYAYGLEEGLAEEGHREHSPARSDATHSQSMGLLHRAQHDKKRASMQAGFMPGMPNRTSDSGSDDTSACHGRQMLLARGAQQLGGHNAPVLDLSAPNPPSLRHHPRDSSGSDASHLKAEPDLMKMLADVAATVEPKQSSQPAHQSLSEAAASGMVDVAGLQRALQNPLFAAGFMEAQRLMSLGLLQPGTPMQQPAAAPYSVLVPIQAPMQAGAYGSVVQPPQFLAPAMHTMLPSGAQMMQMVALPMQQQMSLEEQRRRSKAE